MKINTVKSFALIAGGMALAATLLHGFNPQPDPPAFAAIGITASETARMNVVCQDSSCTVLMGFTDMDGHPIAAVTRQLTRGTAAMISLPAVQIPGEHNWRDGGNRTMLLPAVQVNGRVVAAVEVFDSLTGKTSAYANAAVPQGLAALLRRD